MQIHSNWANIYLKTVKASPLLCVSVSASETFNLHAWWRYFTTAAATTTFTRHWDYEIEIWQKKLNEFWSQGLFTWTCGTSGRWGNIMRWVTPPILWTWLIWNNRLCGQAGSPPKRTVSPTSNLHLHVNMPLVVKRHHRANGLLSAHVTLICFIHSDGMPLAVSS